MLSDPASRKLLGLALSRGPASLLASALLPRDLRSDGGEKIEPRALTRALRRRPNDTLLAEAALNEAIGCRSPEAVDAVLRVLSDRTELARCDREAFSRALRTLEHKGARAFFRNLSAWVKDYAAGDLERRVVREMVRRGFSEESGATRIFRSYCDRGLDYHVIHYGAALARRWEVRADWSADMAAALRRLLERPDAEEARDNALFVVDACGLSILRLVMEIEGCLEPLHGPLSGAAEAGAVTDKQRLTWNFCLSSASISAKQSYLLPRSDESAPSLYDDMLTFCLEDSVTAQLALALEIRDHPELRYPAGFDTGVLLLLCFATWMPEREIPEALLEEMAGRADAFGALRRMRNAIERNGEPGRAFLRRLFDAIATRAGQTLEVLGLRAELGLLAEDAEVVQALNLIRQAGLPEHRERLVELLGGLVQNEQVEIAARICEEESDCLLSDPMSARSAAQVFMAGKNWQRAGQAWEVLSSLASSYQWPLANAYRAFARAGNEAAAAEVGHSLDLGDATYLPALPMLAHSACTIGDFPFARTVLERAGAELESYQADQRGLLAKAQTVALGDLSLFEQPEEDLSGKAPPAAVVIDPGFHYRSGHHFNYGKFSVEFLSEELGVSKDAVWLLTGGEESDHNDLSLEGQVKRVFRFNPYSYSDIAVTEETVRMLNKAVCQDLTRVFRRVDLSQCKVIYVHSMKANMIGGFVRWLDRITAERPITVIVGVIEVDYLLAESDERGHWSRANRRGLSRLFKMANVHPLLYCETERAAMHFRKLLGDDLPMHQFPYLAASLAGRVASRGERALARDTITFGTLGTSTPNRGSDLFPQLVEAFAPLKEVNWVLQLKRRFVEGLGSDRVHCLERAVQRGTCRWYDDRLSVEEYYEAMKQIDVMILPYRDRYAVSGSGVFYEAIQLERFLVVPRQTFMGGVVKEMKYPSALLAQVDLESVAAAIGRVLEEPDRCRRRVNRFGRDGRGRLPIERFRQLLRRTLKEAGGAAVT